MSKRIGRPKKVEVTYLCGCIIEEELYPDSDKTFTKYLNLCKRSICKNCFSEDDVKKLLDPDVESILNNSVEVKDYDSKDGNAEEKS